MTNNLKTNEKKITFAQLEAVIDYQIYCQIISSYPASFQVVEDGYEFFAKRQLVTLFSAPNYCGEFDNAGGMMSVDESLMCSFQVENSVFVAV